MEIERGHDEFDVSFMTAVRRGEKIQVGLKSGGGIEREEISGRM